MELSLLGLSAGGGNELAAASSSSSHHNQLTPFVLGFPTTSFNGTDFFAYKGHKLLVDATTHACAAAARFHGATPAEALAGQICPSCSLDSRLWSAISFASALTLSR